MEVATQAKCAHSCTWPGIQGKVCALRQALLMASSSMRNWPQWLQRLEDLQFAVYMLETQERGCFTVQNQRCSAGRIPYFLEEVNLCSN